MRKFAVIMGLVGVMAGAAETASAATIGLVQDDKCIEHNGTFICDADVVPLGTTGTGLFNPFLRTNPGGNQNPSSGWNTDAHKNAWTQPNDADDSWTSALAASSLGTVTIGGVQYAEFTVDINQQGTANNNGDLLSLLQFQLFNCTTATNTATTAAQGCTSFFNLFGGTITYDANGRPIVSGSTQWVDFDYRLHTGSGSGDISIFIPYSLFAGVQFVSLLDGWGTSGSLGNYGDNDGFQEWRALQGAATCPDGTTPGSGQDCDVTVPEPASLLLFGLAAFGSAYGVRRRRTIA